MSGTMDTTNRLLEYLRMLQTNPAAASYGGLPTEAQLAAPGSAPAPALPPQPARPTATVVSTPDETLPLPPQFMSPEEASGSGSPVVSPSLASRTPSESSSPFAISREEQQALDRLMAFGAALASAEGKSSVAAAGDAFQALARQGAAQRQEGRQERELDINQAYREAQMNLARAEAEDRRDPGVPANQARLLSARADMMRAEAAMARVGESSRNTRDRIVARERGADGRLYLVYESGRIAQAGGEDAPMLMDPANSLAGRRYLDHQNRRASAVQAILTSPNLMPTQRQAAIDQWDRQFPAPPDPFSRGTTAPTATAPTAPTGDLYDPLGRPIR